MKKTGLVLEGGASRGVFTAGALDYVMEQGVVFPYVAGVSAGCCNALDYVSGQIGRTKQCMIVSDKEKQYWSLKHMLKTKSIFDMDMIFDRYPNEYFPFDYEAYFNAETQCEVVATNCLTGRAEYLSETKDKKRLMQISRASSSLPLLSPVVEVDGIPYLDGGLADSIPLSHVLRRGYKKCVVILTRNRGYRKEEHSKTSGFYKAAYKQYPELIKTIKRRPYVYNRQMELVERLEQEGRIFVLRPELPVISRTERKVELLELFFQHGYERMKEQMDAMLSYMEG